MSDYFIELEKKIVKKMKNNKGTIGLHELYRMRGVQSLSDIYTAISRLVQKGIILSKEETKKNRMGVWSHRYKGYALREVLKTKQEGV